MLVTLLLLVGDAPSGLPLSPLCPGKADRQGDNVLLGVVRASVGHYVVPDSDGLLDHDRDSTITRPRAT